MFIRDTSKLETARLMATYFAEKNLAIRRFKWRRYLFLCVKSQLTIFHSCRDDSCLPWLQRIKMATLYCTGLPSVYTNSMWMISHKIYFYVHDRNYVLLYNKRAVALMSLNIVFRKSKDTCKPMSFDIQNWDNTCIHQYN